MVHGSLKPHEPAVASTTSSVAGDYRFYMEQKDIVRVLIMMIDSFVQERPINRGLRDQHKEQCAERLAAEGGNGDGDTDAGTLIRQY